MNKYGIKYLTKITFLEKMFYDSLYSKKLDVAAKLLYKMRIIHGDLLQKYHLLVSDDVEGKVKTSCLLSTILQINYKIVLFENELKKNIGKNQTEDMPLFSGKVNDFDKLIDKEIPTLILFYSNECGACQKTKPEWDEVTKNIVEKFEAIKEKLFNIIEINVADKNNDNIIKMFNIEAIPTFVMIESLNKPYADHNMMTGMANKEKIQQFIKDSYIIFNKIE